MSSAFSLAAGGDHLEHGVDSGLGHTAQISVSMTPAAMALQVILREATSRAVERVGRIKPALAPRSWPGRLAH